jgi:hypothetical protein
MAESEASSQLFTNRLYNQLKFLALVLLPALGTLYFGLSGIWGLPVPEKVIGTITVIDTFLGVVLHLSNNAYYKNGQNFDGDVNVTDHKVSVAFNEDPADLADTPGKHSLELKINKQ